MKIPIPILSAITLAAITGTACGSPPTLHDAGPSPAFSTLPAPSQSTPAEECSASQGQRILTCGPGNDVAMPGQTVAPTSPGGAR